MIPASGTFGRGCSPVFRMNYITPGYTGKRELTAPGLLRLDDITGTGDARLRLAGEPGADELADTMALVAQGRITPIIDQTFSLEDVEAAFDALRNGESLGRNVIAV